MFIHSIETVDGARPVSEGYGENGILIVGARLVLARARASLLRALVGSARDATRAFPTGLIGLRQGLAG